MVLGRTARLEGWSQRVEPEARCRTAMVGGSLRHGSQSEHSLLPQRLPRGRLGKDRRALGAGTG